MSQFDPVKEANKIIMESEQKTAAIDEHKDAMLFAMRLARNVYDAAIEVGFDSNQSFQFSIITYNNHFANSNRNGKDGMN